MTERTELINDIEKLKAERNRLLRQVEEAVLLRSLKIKRALSELQIS